MEKIDSKVSRDPVLGEIRLSPLELLAADLPSMQRLRYVTQLSGAEKVYPGATHTRFLHSLGVMHISGLYAEHLQTDPKKTRILRLSGLFHDIGHGPYSHQFDEIVYTRAHIEGGHDTQRERILNEVVPFEMIKEYKCGLKEYWQQEVQKDLQNSGFASAPLDETGLLEAFKEVCKSVTALFQGETEGSPYFNIVQGPLGADRMDFVLRDAYYCGTAQYGMVDLQRIIRNSSLIGIVSRYRGLASPTQDREVERLSYDGKVIDNIYAVLFGRFMMYKNVYFHKTARAADLMLQRILDLLYEPMKLEEVVNNTEEFVKYSEFFFMQKFWEAYTQRNNFPEKQKKNLEEAYRIIEDYTSRNLWKIIKEVSFSITGVDPGSVANSVGMDNLQRIKNNIQKFLSKKESLPEEEKIRLEWMISNPQEVFHIDTPYKLSIAHPAEFFTNQVYIGSDQQDGGKPVDFEEFLKENPFYQSLSGNLIQLVRIYVESTDRELLQKYGLIPSKDRLTLTTRW